MTNGSLKRGAQRGIAEAAYHRCCVPASSRPSRLAGRERHVAERARTAVVVLPTGGPRPCRNASGPTTAPRRNSANAVVEEDDKVEAARWAAQAELADRKLREAMARGTPAALMLARAEADEAAAELALSRSKLARVEIRAPFDGVVVRGDLSQQLGAPVEQGKVLFEVVPMAAWRVVLKIDERDILQLREGATGELVLSGLPGVRHNIVVSRIAPVAVAEDGLNTFRVEAQVQGGPALIQPGMEGVGKINAGERSALWISGHRLVDWLGFVAWKIGF